jgi:uncharacterized protein (TIGR02001 family)
MKALKTAIFAATMMSGATAMAAEVSGNVAIGSEYFFRGIDQSGGEALSGGFDVAFENGFYVGTWASSVNFAGGLELDYYAGYGGSFSEAVSYDVGYLFYGYPQGESADNDEFEELYASVSFGDATVGIALSSDYYGATGDTTYAYVDYGFALGEDFSLGFHYGTMSADDDVAYTALLGKAGDDYAVSLSTEAAGLGFDLSLLDYSEDGADMELVLTISKSL